MTDSVLQKAIALILLIFAGYLLKPKFKDPASVGAIRNFILNAALPATIFLSTIEIDTKLDLVVLPSFALAINLALMVMGCLVAWLLMRNAEKAKTRAMILLFPSLAPGLTVYPFIEQFLGRQGLAWAALADMGNKLFVLIGLYALAIYWYQQSAAENPQASVKFQWKSIGTFLFTEPVNIAIVLGFLIAFWNASGLLPLALSDAIRKLAACATPLILFYVGISFNPKAFQFGTLAMVLLARTGVGFLISAAAIALLKPTSVEALTLFVALPQASCSLWPLLHATKINTQRSLAVTQPVSDARPIFFDTEFATSLLAMSFPFSILVLLIVFSSGQFFQSPVHLGLSGGICLGGFALLLGLHYLPIQFRSPIDLHIQVKTPFVRKPKKLKLLDASSTLSTHNQLLLVQVESAGWITPEQETILKQINQLVQQKFSTEIHDQAISLQFKYLIKEQILMVIGQHENHPIPDLAKKLKAVSEAIKGADLRSLEQVRFYFRIFAEKKPYSSYSLMLKSTKPAPYIAQ
ncbi:AEC family transporter [Pantanalinema rosaneae CENA516]|uniref:AEC family transporter n=1 Tax=Pantanalinema rosaneae TaxID=1620701 RepID=UPI003D6E47F6